jgi:type I restriction enzyme S subunit
MSWQTSRISDVLIDARPGFACGEEPSEGVFQFRMNNVTTEGTLNLSKKRRVPASTRNIDAFLVESGDVLFNATNSPELVGKTVYFPGHEEPVVFSNHFLRLRPSPERLDGRFLARWLHLQFQQRIFQGMCHQWVNQATVRRDSLLALTVPLPPLPEQRLIAEILDRAEEIRAKRRSTLAKLDTLTQAIFLDMFGNPATNTKDWPRRSLKALGKVTTGGTPPSSMDGMFNGPIPFVTPGDLERDEPVKRSLTNEGAEESVSVRAGATLVCCIGATIGKMAKARERSAFNQQINAVEWTGEIDDRYGLAVLRFFKPTIVAWGASTTLPILKKSTFEKIEIPVPPLPLQREFAHRVEAVEKLKTEHRVSLAEMGALFASLQHRAFNGEL